MQPLHVELSPGPQVTHRVTPEQEHVDTPAAIPSWQVPSACKSDNVLSLGKLSPRADTELFAYTLMTSPPRLSPTHYSDPVSLLGTCQCPGHDGREPAIVRCHKSYPGLTLTSKLRDVPTWWGPSQPPSCPAPHRKSVEVIP